MGMNIYIIILCARCRRGSRPAVSWCAMPLYMVVLPAFAPCPVIVPMLHVLPVYASPAAPHAHAVMLAAPGPVRIMPRRALALLTCARCRMHAAYMSMCLYVYVSTRLHVYMYTCLHVYKLPPEMAYLSAIWNAQRDKQRPEQ